MIKVNTFCVGMFVHRGRLSLISALTSLHRVWWIEHIPYSSITLCSDLNAYISDMHIICAHQLRSALIPTPTQSKARYKAGSSYFFNVIRVDLICMVIWYRLVCTVYSLMFVDLIVPVHWQTGHSYSCLLSYLTHGNNDCFHHLHGYTLFLFLRAVT